MTWTNAFDVGECTVKVTDYAGDDMYSGVLGKGEGAAVDDGGYDLGLRIDVDASGQVALTATNPDWGLYITTISVRVIPSYAIADSGIRETALELAQDYGAYAFSLAGAGGAGPDAANRVEITGTAPPSPDPAVLTSMVNKEEISLGFGLGGGW